MDLDILGGWRVVSGRLWRLLKVLSFHSETGLIITVFGLNKVGFLLDIEALRGLMVPTVAILAKSATDHKEVVRLVLLNRRR